ncbi:hypothetical protein GGI12_002113 [Dipsacomyces acuminosporus]|nr:hypothetical protein GGI12_002113 [Dipsacomyces acuminosporus]
MPFVRHKRLLTARTVQAVLRLPAHTASQACVSRSFHVLSSTLESRADGHPVHASDAARNPSAESKDRRKHRDSDDVLELDSVFDMLQLPGNRASGTADGQALSDKLSSSRSNGMYQEEDVSLDDIFSMFDENTKRKPDQTERSPSTLPAARSHDPMEAFERILSDLAAENAQVYKKERPAPRFWDEDGGQTSPQQDRRFKKALDPEQLFKKGPRVSAFSAGKLASDPSRISSLAARIQKETAAAGGEGALGMQSKPRMNRDKEAEQIQLSRLAQCQSLPALTKLAGSILLARRSADQHQSAEPAVRPSPLVAAQMIKLAREFQAPYFAYYIYNHCRTELDLADKLRVLDSPVYEELLVTAWSSKRDISAVIFILRDLIAVGVTASGGLARQIDKIITDLHKEHSLPKVAAKITALKNKIELDVASAASADPVDMAALTSRFSL